MKKVYVIIVTLLLAVGVFSMSTVVNAEEGDLNPYYEDLVFDKVVVGSHHSGAITSDGRVFTWGRNEFGQLGDGTTIDKRNPTEITSQFGLLEGEIITEMSFGIFHSGAITSEGRIFTWGFNRFGELGNGTYDSYLPHPVPMDITSQFGLSAGEKMEQINLNTTSSAITSTGRVFTWGKNVEGTIGNGTNDINVHPTPVEITSFFNLSTGETIVDMSLGYYHSAVLTSSNRVFTWGGNYSGVLGDGTTTRRNYPLDITSYFGLDPGETISSISMGQYHSGAVTSEGRVFLWGTNSYGELNDGTSTDKIIPTDITSQMSLSAGETVISIFLGYYVFSVITSNDRVLIWGFNWYGQLGDGTIISRFNPIDITSQFNLDSEEVVTRITVTNYHSAAFTSEGRIFIWGYNGDGQVGDGTIINKPNPTLIIITEITYDTEAPIITLNGDSVVYVEYGEDYTELGATVTDNYDETGIANYGPNGEPLDTFFLGTYMIEYTATDSSGNTAEPVIRYVVVRDTEAPIITLNGDSVVYVEYGEDYTELGANYTDNHGESGAAIIGGTLVDTSVLGTYIVTYNITDTSGNNAIEIKRTVIVQDTEAPVITLTGDSIVYVKYNKSYIELGATFTDNYDESGTVIVSGDIVDVKKPGTYTITYTITDSNGNNATEVTRTVIVTHHLNGTHFCNHGNGNHNYHHNHNNRRCHNHNRWNNRSTSNH